MKRKYPLLGLCFDWETSGTDWGDVFAMKHQGVSLGMVVFNMDTLLPVDNKYIEIKFDDSRYEWTEAAERTHGLSRDHLQQYGLTQEEAAIEVVEFLLKYFGPNPTIHVMGHNIHFDISYMEQLLKPFDMMFNIFHRRIETSSMSFIAFGDSYSNTLFDIVGLEERNDHNALEDALMTLEAARRVRLLVHSALYD